MDGNGEQENLRKVQRKEKEGSGKRFNMKEREEGMGE
jgi:hypothetical protein